MSGKIKRNAPVIAMLGSLAIFSSACTVDDVLTLAKIIGLFL